MRLLRRVAMLLIVSALGPVRAVALPVPEPPREEPPDSYPGGYRAVAQGAIVAWQDRRNGMDWDIYVQRVNPRLWTRDGVPVCTRPSDQNHPTNDQDHPMIISDGAGGAIVTWEDFRDGNYDIYAQRLSPTGVSLWPGDGVALCKAVYQQEYPVLVSDGAQGAIVAWADFRTGLQWDVYAQHVNAIGTALWGDGAGDLNGVPLTVGANVWQTSIVSDGAGGAIVTWIDYRNGPAADVYTRRVSAAGTPMWNANGVELCRAPGQQDVPVSLSDGAGGAIVTWQDDRGVDWDVYARRVSAAGAALGAVDGVALCTAAGDQKSPQIASDGAGGAIVAWEDARGGPNRDIYARRMSAAGAALWAANGVALCTAANDQYVPRIVSDGAGGAIVAWIDTRLNIAAADIFAQRVDGAGSRQWIANGVQMTATGSVEDLTIATDAAGNATVAWGDFRTGIDADIYAGSVTKAGVVQWNSNLTGVALCTAAKDQLFASAAPDQRLGITTASEVRERRMRSGSLGNQPRDHGAGAPLEPWLSGASPNPAREGTEVRLRLPQAAEVRMDVFDNGGRRVRGIPVGARSAGDHVLRWDGRDDTGQPVATGLYYLRLGAAGYQLMRRLVVVR